MKTKRFLLLLILGFSFSVYARNKEKNYMIVLKDSIEIETSVEELYDWFVHLESNFVPWSERHTKFELLSGGLEPGDIIYFEQCVEGVWYKVKAEIISREVDREGFSFTVESTTGLAEITFSARAISPERLVFTHTESFGYGESYFGKIGNFLLFKVFFRKQGNWELIMGDMKKDDASLKRILEG